MYLSAGTAIIKKFVTELQQTVASELAAVKLAVGGLQTQALCQSRNDCEVQDRNADSELCARQLTVTGLRKQSVLE